jgi:cation transport ATPase
MLTGDNRTTVEAVANTFQSMKLWPISYPTKKARRLKRCNNNAILLQWHEMASMTLPH